MSQARYWLGVLLVVSIPPAVLWWFLIHPFVAFWRNVGVRVTLALMGVMLAGGMVGLYFVRTTLIGADLGPSLLTAIPGFLLLGSAVWIGIKRRRQLTTRILVGVPELEETGRGGRLLTDGMYARIRNPRYVEVVLGTLGYALVANYVGVYLVALATAPAIHLIVLLEERELAARFGDEYEAYRARVPRYVPR